MAIPSDAPRFSIVGDFKARVTSLHDGDTFTCVFMYAGRYNTFNVRINGIDTPEMTSHTPAAFDARNRLFQLLTTNTLIDTRGWKKKDFDEYFRTHYTEVTVSCTGFDKYGRVLVNVGSIADTLIREGHAYSYTGGTKEKFT